MIIKNYTRVLADSCRENIDLTNLKLSDEYGYAHLSLCVIDSVFSIGVKYASVQNTISRFCDYVGISQGELKNDKEFSISNLIRLFEEYGIDHVTNQVFDNRQRTSSRNGILKSEAVFRFANVLKEFETDFLSEIRNIVGNPDFEAGIMTIPGQKSGISLRYFYMLAGEENYIKPDRMIRRFIKNVLNKNLTSEEISRLLIETSKALKREFPEITARSLDHAIWQYQREN